MRDFSGGQLNAGCMRADETPQYRNGAAKMSDWLIETTNTIVPRPGRRLIAATGAPRVEYARLGSTDYAVAFDVNANGTGRITIYDLASATIVARQAAAVYLWNLLTVEQIYMCVCDFQIVVCFPGMRPQLAIREPTTAIWTFGQFAFRTITSQTQQPFYRSSALGATMTYDANVGPCLLTCSAPYFTQAMVGNYISILGQQVQITAVLGPLKARGTILNQLPDFIILATSQKPPFQVGQVAAIVSPGGQQQLTMEIDLVEDYFAPPAPGQSFPSRAGISGVLTSAVINSYRFSVGDLLVSEMGSAPITGTLTGSSGLTVQWQEQFMGDSLGWPQACAYDRGRLIFFDFPQKPEAILWSAVGAYDVFWIDSSAAKLQTAAGASPNSAILEFIPDSPRVRHVIGWGDAFVFTDKGIYEIPISAAGNPLQPGSVEFRQFSNDGVAPVVPIKTLDSIVYINAGAKRASVVIRTGSYTNPYSSDGASELYTDLFTGPIAMVVAQGDGQFPERLIYVLNQDGTIIHGKFSSDRKFVGWMPWSSGAPPSWLFCSGPTVYYCMPLAGSYWLAAEDRTLFLDVAATPNARPLGFPRPPAGQGPLWFLAGATVTMMKNGVQDLGDTTVDANGNLVVPAGVDVTPPDLTVGLSYRPALTPFVPAMQPGESIGQRQHRRKISRAMVTAQMCSGFALGSRNVPAYLPGDDATQPPLLRTVTQQVRPLGRSFDPACPLVKTRPGPLRIVEYLTEATI